VAASGSRTTIVVLRPAVSLVSINPNGSHDYPSRDPRALASCGLSLLLAGKSRSLGGRPQIETDLRALIWRMSVENPLWGAPRNQAAGAACQGWRTFLRNHAPDIAAMDSFVVPTIGFKLLYGFVIIRLDRRDLVWINVTTNPTANWIARQITEAFPWNETPRYMIRV
jgi:hypothetical protein